MNLAQILSEWLESCPLRDYGSSLLPLVQEAACEDAHGDLGSWCRALAEMHDLQPSHVALCSDAITIGRASDVDDIQALQLREQLQLLHPWRKGPFSLFGIDIDTEWRSNLKWQRLASAIEPLNGRRVLDVGCGNGYYLWRMRGMGAAEVVGIDPALKFLIQFLACRRFLPDEPVWLLPLKDEQLPSEARLFDTVFSMGVLYHRRSPVDHLLQLRDMLRPGGELVLETLVIDGDAQQILVPEGRYAQMRNVWFIPSTLALENWLRRAGFKAVRTIDVCQTTSEEQRGTEWMRFHSLTDFLEPGNPDKTVEGYPAPKRAILLAKA